MNKHKNTKSLKRNGWKSYNIIYNELDWCEGSFVTLRTRFLRLIALIQTFRNDKKYKAECHYKTRPI